MNEPGRILTAMYEAMRSHFGPLHWWPTSASLTPAQEKLEICVGAILTQNTNWTNVEKALARLRAAGCVDVAHFDALGEDELAAHIRSAGYFNVKARRIRAFIAEVRRQGEGDIEAFLDRPIGVLRPVLLGINGIGPETADSMILYAAGRATFVVDAYTRRALARHGLVEPSAGYDEIKHLFETNLPPDASLYNDYHAQWVAVGKHFCRPSARCEGCPLAGFDHDETIPPAASPKRSPKR